MQSIFAVLFSGNNSLTWLIRALIRPHRLGNVRAERFERKGKTGCCLNPLANEKP